MATTPPPPDGPPEPPTEPPPPGPEPATPAGPAPRDPAAHPPAEQAPVEPAAPDPDSQPRTRSRAGLVAIVAGAVVLLALVLVVTQRDPVTLPPDSPEATVQAFLRSMVDGDPDTTLLVDTECPPPRPEMVDDLSLRATVVDTTVDGDTAEVVLDITERYGGGMLDDGYRHEETWWLVATPDGWRIAGFDWPWDECWNASFPNGG